MVAKANKILFLQQLFVMMEAAFACSNKVSHNLSIIVKIQTHY